jgi:hypothetical protein
MARFLVLAVAAAALPALGGCDILIDECVDATFYPDYGIELKNAGAWEVRMTVVYDEWEEGEDDAPDELVTKTRTTGIVAGEKVTKWYPHEPLDVKIERIVDGRVLFQDHFSAADFDREHDRVELTVYP